MRGKNRLSPALGSALIAIFIVLFGLRTYILSGPINPAELQLNAAVTSPSQVPNWPYLPASDVTSQGIKTQPADFVIVKQDGNFGQTNLPVNSYGQYMKAPGNFSVKSVIEPSAATCTWALYDSPPIIADEFRIEPTGIRVSLAKNSSNVEIWANRHVGNPYQQQPSRTAHTAISNTTSHVVIVERQNGSYSIKIDGQTAYKTTLAAFRSGNVWFGLSGSGGQCRLNDFQTSGKGTIVADSAKVPAIPLAAQGLQALAAQKRSGFLVGAAVALGPTVSDSTYQSELFGNFGSMTPENAMKWQFIEPQKGIFTFQEADALVAIAQKKRMSVHGHTLVFSEANPAWVTNLPTKTNADKQAVQSIMANHISTIMTHYKGKVASWDVVNEPLADYDQFTSDQPLRQNIWLKAMGSSYIASALKSARQADPSAKLFINEYGLEEDGDRWDAFVNLVTALKKNGVPLDGVGFQAHVYDATDDINSNVLNKHINQLAALGLVSRISEMDVYDDDGTAVQAAQYSQVFMTCLRNPNCVSFTTWGVDDRYDDFIDDDGTVQNGSDLLFDRGKPTPAYVQLQQSLH